MLETRVREPDGVEHAAAELRHPGRGVAVARQARDGFGHQSAETLEVHDPGELAPETGGPGGQNQRVLKGTAEDGTGERGLAGHGSNRRRVAPGACCSVGWRRPPGATGCAG